jgi:hypothetical protein
MSEDYKGMSEESAREYEEAQRRPMFRRASAMPQVKEHFDNLVCGYARRTGCKVQLRDPRLYACIYHQAMQAIGTEFFVYYGLVSEADRSKMSFEQIENLENRREYMTKWMDNFPRGAVP